MQFLTKSPHAIDDLLRLFFNPPNFSAHFTRNILAHEIKTPLKDFNKSIDIKWSMYKIRRQVLGHFQNPSGPYPYQWREAFKKYL